jgi:hypothetical protein
MKITVSCQKCGRVLAVAEKDVVTQDDLNMYMASCSCQFDGPFPAVMGPDDEGNYVELEPAISNTIIAVMTES